MGKPRIILVIALLAHLPSMGGTPDASPDSTGMLRPGAVIRIEGRVVTTSGSPVSGARVRPEGISSESAATAATDADGRFALDVLCSEECVLIVEAPGFAPVRERLKANVAVPRPEIVLSPTLRERTAVTATRTPARIADTAPSVAVLSSDDLAAAGAARIDDVLRQVPGFALFRRSGSRTANPTIQGASLRGIGASGAGRALVLDDLIPLNDPFGGWVYWGRLPRIAIGRVEILRGGASDLYGSTALSGVVNLIRLQEDSPFLAAEAFYGTERTYDASLWAGGRQGEWGGSIDAEAFHTRGYTPVAEEERGSVDTPAGCRDAVVEATGERWFSDENRVFLRGSWFDESRENGTVLQENDTNIEQAAAGWDHRSQNGTLSLRIYGNRQRYHQSFSSVAADRESETLTRLQSVPSRAAGLAVQWSRSIGRQRLVAGTDYRRVSGTTRELGPGGDLLLRAGGRQENAGVFVEDIVEATPRLSFTAAGRFDRWKNFDASRESAGPTTLFADRTSSVVSPRASVLVRVGGGVSLTGSAYRSFRTPTLNELYRPFRVGNVLTLANEDLKAEKLTGTEAGVQSASSNGRFFARGGIFWMRVDDPVANVTLSETPGPITRQRRNLGRLRSRGIELEAMARPGGGWTLEGGALLADSIVERFPADRSLEGLRVGQVPRYQYSLRLAYSGRAAGTIGLQARWIGMQFDDDRNEFPLGSYSILDGLYARPLPRGPGEIFVAGENLLDERYDIGRTPVLSIGAPRTVRAGFRVRLGRSGPESPPADGRFY